MKVRINKFVKVETEVEVFIDEEVEVCMDDVMAGFFHEVLSENHGAFSGNGTLSGLLDRITKVLSLIPDDRISELTPVLQEHHRDRLFAQAERFGLWRVSSPASPKDR